jgi:hypothetical protein
MPTILHTKPLRLTSRSNELIADMSATSDHSPFLAASSEHINNHPVHDVPEPIAYEPASDGLAFCKQQRGMLSWFRGYTRAGCRCGQCPLNQVEPCEYALPERWVPIAAQRGL